MTYQMMTPAPQTPTPTSLAAGFVAQRTGMEERAVQAFFAKTSLDELTVALQARVQLHAQGKNLLAINSRIASMSVRSAVETTSEYSAAERRMASATNLLNHLLNLQDQWIGAGVPLRSTQAAREDRRLADAFAQLLAGVDGVMDTLSGPDDSKTVQMAQQQLAQARQRFDRAIEPVFQEGVAAKRLGAADAKLMQAGARQYADQMFLGL